MPKFLERLYFKKSKGTNIFTITSKESPIAPKKKKAYVQFSSQIFELLGDIISFIYIKKNS